MSTTTKKSRNSGRVIRVSEETYLALEKKRNTGFASWDSCMRWLLGLPERTWKSKSAAAPLKQDFPKLREVWLVPGVIRYFTTKAAARGEAVRQAALSETDSVPKTIRMREVL